MFKVGDWIEYKFTDKWACGNKGPYKGVITKVGDGKGISKRYYLDDRDMSGYYNFENSDIYEYIKVLNKVTKKITLGELV